MANVNDQDDLAIPDFLKVPKRKLTPEELKGLIGGGPRTWAPIRDPKDIPPAPPQPIYVNNAKAPVTVNVRTKDGPVSLATYDNMADFDAHHDRGTYPVVRSASDNTSTIILVSAKPWAGKIATVPGINDPTPPTGAQVRTQRSRDKDDKLLAAVLAVLANGPLGRGPVQAALVADAWDKQMLDNSLGGRLNRMADAGQLTKNKDGGKVLYGAPATVTTAVQAEAKAVAAAKVEAKVDKVTGRFPRKDTPVVATNPKPARKVKRK